MREGRRLFPNRELDFLFTGSMRSTKHANSLSKAVSLARVLADDLARVLVVAVIVVGERVERDQAFDEQVGKFDEEAELGDAGDQAVEVFAHAVLHELDLLPFHEFALGLVGAALGVTGLFGDVVEFVESRWARRKARAPRVGGMVAAFGPGRWGVF